MKEEVAMMKPSLAPIDIEAIAEAAHVQAFGRFITHELQVLVPRQVRRWQNMRVLDVACGTGDWVYEVAYHYPRAEVVGIDLSETMLDIARAGARGQGLENASFERMDATEPLDFSNESFDFVNLRFANSFLTQTSWPTLIRDCVRVTQPGGYIRVIELDGFSRTNNEPLTQLQQCFAQAWSHNGQGHLLTPTPYLGQWLREAGCVHLRQHLRFLDYCAPWPDTLTEEQQTRYLSMCQHIEKSLLLLTPYLLAHSDWSRQKLEGLMQQATARMMLSSFRGHTSYLYVVAQKAEESDADPHEPGSELARKHLP